MAADRSCSVRVHGYNRRAVLPRGMRPRSALRAVSTCLPYPPDTGLVPNFSEKKFVCAFGFGGYGKVELFWFKRPISMKMSLWVTELLDISEFNHHKWLYVQFGDQFTYRAWDVARGGGLRSLLCSAGRVDTPKLTVSLFWPPLLRAVDAVCFGPVLPVFTNCLHACGVPRLLWRPPCS